MTPTPQAPNLTQIIVTPPSPSIVAGQTQQFIATGIYNNGSAQDLTQQVAWSSSIPAVATIDVTGLATSVTEGDTTIIATSGGTTGTTLLMINPLDLVAVTAVPASLNLQTGQTQQFGAVGLYSDASQQNLTPDVTWSSSNPGVVSIDAAGFATAIAAGAASITATSGALSSSSVVTVAAASALPPPPLPGSPADYLLQAQQAMFQLLLGNKPSRVDTPQLGSVEFAVTTPAQLQRVIDYLNGLVMAGNVWPTDGTGGSMNAGYQRGRKPLSFFGWP